MNMECFLGHEWGKWVETNRGNILSQNRWGMNREKVVTGRWVDQERMCAKCGKIEIDQQVIEI